jgi:hypothetical protein
VPGISVRRLREHVDLSRSWHAKNVGRRPKRYNGAWDDICQIAAHLVDARAVPSSLRYVFYRLVTLGILENSLSEYTALATSTAAARRAGWFPRLVDHNREIWRPWSWDSLNEALTYSADRPIDRDRGQPYAIFVPVDKATVAESVKHWL